MTFPSEAEAAASRADHDRDRVGLRAFFRIMDLWGIDNNRAQILLGRPSRATFFKWKRGDVANVPFDTLRRISYILGIYKALQILYREPELADRWVKAPNMDFGGQSAMDRMMGGDVTDLAVVREYLDAARGGWS